MCVLRIFLLAILIALAAGLALSGCATVSAVNPKELPVLPKMLIVPPSPNLSPKMAAFLGTWEGMWDGVLAARLIVYKIDGQLADYIYAWAANPGQFRMGYDISVAKLYPEGKLEWTQPGKLRGYETTFTFTMSDDLKTIKGVRRGTSWSSITMHKVE